MKKLLRILLPPFTGFAVYFLIVRYSGVYFSLRPNEMGAGNIEAFMAYYRYLMPLLFTVSVLTQLLIVNPVWRRAKDKSRAWGIRAMILLLLICALFAFGIGYAIWDKSTGFYHLVKLFSFFIVVQLVYWMINLFILRLLSREQRLEIGD